MFMRLCYIVSIVFQIDFSLLLFSWPCYICVCICIEWNLLDKSEIRIEIYIYWGAYTYRYCYLSRMCDVLMCSPLIRHAWNEYWNARAWQWSSDIGFVRKLLKMKLLPASVRFIHQTDALTVTIQECGSGFIIFPGNFALYVSANTPTGLVANPFSTDSVRNEKTKRRYSRFTCTFPPN